MCADEGKVARNKEAISFMAHKKEKHTHSPRAHGWIISGRCIGNWQECLLLGRGTGKLVWEENLNFTAYSLVPLCMIFIFQEKNKLNFFFLSLMTSNSVEKGRKLTTFEECVYSADSA